MLIKTLPFVLTFLVLHSIAVVAQPATTQNSNTFAFKFYQQWSRQTDGNIVLSPFSISASIAMTYPGARNKTADQMKTAMQFHANARQQSEEFHLLMSAINAEGSPMVIANTLWMQKGFKIEQNLSDVNARYFGAGFRKVNFAGAPDSTRVAINALIEKQTNDKITNLLPAGSINSLTRLVLTNAIYFKDAWAVPFSRDKTKDRDFFVTPGKPIKAKFMEHQNVTFNYTDNDGATIVELPSKNKRFSMLIVLPKHDLADLQKALHTIPYGSWKLKPGRFKTVQVPRFKIDHEVEPVRILKHFGMTSAFQESEADFRGISKDTRLFISGIFHKAFVEVNEEGTEAAAATAVVAQAESIEEPQPGLDFIANKPFMFILRDRITNNILFMGQVKNPAIVP
jgi:serpin B